MLAQWHEGYEQVVGIRTKHEGQGRVKALFSGLFYSIMQKISEVDIERGETDFRLLDRQVVDAFNALPERQRMVRTLLNWVGFRRTTIEFVADERAYGVASYSTIKLVRLALHSFVSNSLLPLRATGYLGIVITTISFPTGLAIFAQRYIFNDALNWGITGSAQLAIILVFLIGIVLTALGLIALYIENIHKEAIDRPLYVVRPHRTAAAAQKKEVVVAVSGGFDPVHIGHVRMFEEAKKLGTKLVIILNNDNWLTTKKGSAFMPELERRELLLKLACVDDVILTEHVAADADRSVSRTLATIKPHIFANGGDRKSEADIPELNICREHGIDMVFNVGGGKIQSSSWLLANK
jgi:cytidyltransferase-like protein